MVVRAHGQVFDAPGARIRRAGHVISKVVAWRDKGVAWRDRSLVVYQERDIGFENQKKK